MDVLRRLVPRVPFANAARKARNRGGKPTLFAGLKDNPEYNEPSVPLKSPSRKPPGARLLS